MLLSRIFSKNVKDKIFKILCFRNFEINELNYIINLKLVKISYSIITNARTEFVFYFYYRKVIIVFFRKQVLKYSHKE